MYVYMLSALRIEGLRTLQSLSDETFQHQHCKVIHVFGDVTYRDQTRLDLLKKFEKEEIGKKDTKTKV